MLKVKDVVNKANPAEAMYRAYKLAETIAEGITERAKYENLHTEEVLKLKYARKLDKQKYEEDSLAIKDRTKALKALLELKESGADDATIQAFKDAVCL